MKFTIEEFLEKLPLPANEKWKEGVWFTNAFSKGNFELEFFAPKGKDYQTPHEKDEIYVVVRGSGEFVKGNERLDFTAGDVLFVEAGVEHRFENFSEDFATWVIFF
ncbi:MAG TPA: cupin domain-containing protein [Pyrinomonadaceae bacterium]|nr:cupin domain-containing protein [Pyrinomonadaceae bacterium]